MGRSRLIRRSLFLAVVLPFFAAPNPANLRADNINPFRPGGQDDPPPPNTDGDDDGNEPAAWKAEPNGADFTPWMSGPELTKFLSRYDTTPPGGHPNYWDKGHWINAVEGRWADGEAEFRIAYGHVPAHGGLWWYWYYGVNQPFFNSIAAKLGADGFTLLDSNSFSDPNGQVRCQGVWHKVTP